MNLKFSAKNHPQKIKIKESQKKMNLITKKNHYLSVKSMKFYKKVKKNLRHTKINKKIICSKLHNL